MKGRKQYCKKRIFPRIFGHYINFIIRYTDTDFVVIPFIVYVQ